MQPITNYKLTDLVDTSHTADKAHSLPYQCHIVTPSEDLTGGGGLLGIWNQHGRLYGMGNGALHSRKMTKFGNYVTFYPKKL